jgi:hypothetical protein
MKYNSPEELDIAIEAELKRLSYAIGCDQDFDTVVKHLVKAKRGEKPCHLSPGPLDLAIFEAFEELRDELEGMEMSRCDTAAAIDDGYYTSRED